MVSLLDVVYPRIQPSSRGDVLVLEEMMQLMQIIYIELKPHISTANVSERPANDNPTSQNRECQ
jgi:hypothetical protein